MTRRLLLAGAALCAVLGVQTARAETFQQAPETNWTQWAGAFPYQRDIYWNFSVNPVGGPSASGTPGADYEGALDPELMSSDAVSFTGSMEWFTAATSPDGVAGIGIDNTSSTDTLTGSVTFDLANVSDNLPVDNIWLELTGLSPSGPEATLSISADGSQFTGDTALDPVELDSGLILQDFGLILQPNPSAEQIVFTFSVAPGTYDVINSVQIATQSVPEPSTWAMLLAGFAGLGLAGYRARRSTSSAA
jgi:hypothetical protein